MLEVNSGYFGRRENTISVVVANVVLLLDKGGEFGSRRDFLQGSIIEA